MGDQELRHIPRCDLIVCHCDLLSSHTLEDVMDACWRGAGASTDGDVGWTWSRSGRRLPTQPGEQRHANTLLLDAMKRMATQEGCATLSLSKEVLKTSLVHSCRATSAFSACGLDGLFRRP